MYLYLVDICKYKVKNFVDEKGEVLFCQNFLVYYKIDVVCYQKSLCDVRGLYGGSLFQFL